MLFGELLEALSAWDKARSAEFVGTRRRWWSTARFRLTPTATPGRVRDVEDKAVELLQLAHARLRFLHEALDNAAALLGDGMFAGDVGPHMCCGEANAIVEMLAAADYTSAAVTFLSGHAEGDDHEDSHYIGEPIVDDEGEVVPVDLVAYVADMVMVA